jgi:hypothetical protein
MLSKVGCVDGCQLTTYNVDLRPTHHCLATYRLRCAHGVLYQNTGTSTFDNGDIGPSNVVTEFVKHVKSKGAMKGNLIMPSIWYFCLYKFTFFVFDDNNSLFFSVVILIRNHII